MPLYLKPQLLTRGLYEICAGQAIFMVNYKVVITPLSQQTARQSGSSQQFRKTLPYQTSYCVEML